MTDYRILNERNYQIEELERDNRYSIRVRLNQDENHKGRWYSKTKMIQAKNKIEAIIAAV